MPRVVLSQQSLTLSICLLCSSSLSSCLCSPHQRTYSSYMGKTRRTLLSTACLPLRGMYLCRLQNFSDAAFTLKYIILTHSANFNVVLRVPQSVTLPSGRDEKMLLVRTRLCVCVSKAFQGANNMFCDDKMHPQSVILRKKKQINTKWINKHDTNK